MGNKEKWVGVIGYEQLYEVSDLGNFRSLDRWRRAVRNQSLFLLKGKSLKTWKNNKGYTIISLRKDNKAKFFLAHRLVYESFKGKTDLDIDHIIEGDKKDIRLSNLQALTDRENITKGYLHKNKSSKYTGVCFNKERKKWQVNIRLNKIKYNLGYFINEEDAGMQYQKVLRDYLDNGLLPPPKEKTSSYKGISFDKSRNKWVFQLMIKGKRIRSKRFETELEAIEYHKLTVSEFTNNIF